MMSVWRQWIKGKGQSCRQGGQIGGLGCDIGLVARAVGIVMQCGMFQHVGIQGFRIDKANAKDGHIIIIVVIVQTLLVKGGLQILHDRLDLLIQGVTQVGDGRAKVQIGIGLIQELDAWQLRYINDTQDEIIQAFGTVSNKRCN